MFRRTLVATLALVAIQLPVVAAEQVLSLDLETSVATFELGSTLHTVHGTLHLEKGTIVFDLDSGKASGQVVFDATLTRTGNAKRDEKMHTKVLESVAFPEIVFRPETVEGSLAESGSSDLTLRGTVSILGAEHAVTLEARVEREGAAITIVSGLTIPFVEWGIHDPSVFVFRTDKKVEVSLELHGTLAD